WGWASPRWDCRSTSSCAGAAPRWPLPCDDLPTEREQALRSSCFAPERAMSTAFVADSEDNQARMQQAIAAQMRDRDAALMQYFYRSDVVYQRELETIFFKSWLWAGHVSQIPE